MVNMFDEVRKVEDGANAAERTNPEDGGNPTDAVDPSDPYQRGTLTVCHVCSCRPGVGFVGHGWFFGGA